MNNDIIFNVLLWTDITTLTAYCLTSKNIPTLRDRHFWHEKFKHDNLPLYNDDFINTNNTNEWLKYLKHVGASKTKAIKLIELVKLEHGDKETTVFGTFDVPTCLIVNGKEYIAEEFDFILNIVLEDGYHECIALVTKDNTTELIQVTIEKLIDILTFIFVKRIWIRITDDEYQCNYIVDTEPIKANYIYNPDLYQKMLSRYRYW